MPAATTIPIAPGGIKSYYQAKIESSEILINQKTQNLRRLEAQRNALNARGQCFYDLKKYFFKIKVLILLNCSASIARGAPIASRARQLCWRSGESNGKDQGFGQGPTRGQI